MERSVDESEDDQRHPGTIAKPHLCRYCRMEISEDAKVCHHCQSNQNILLANLSRFALLISFGLLVLTGLQLHEARNNRILTEQTVVQAERARKAAETALIQAEQVKKVILKMDVDFRNAVKSFAENNYIIDRQYPTFGSTKSANDRFGRNIELLSQYAIPVKMERDQWMRSLESLYPIKK